MRSGIPLVDAATLESGDPAVLEALRIAFGEFGILHVSNHGIEDRWLDELYGSFTEFCARSEADKREMSRPDLWFQRGWTPPNTEVAIASGGQPDFKECFFACCTDLDPADALLHPAINCGNVWPSGLAAFPEQYERMAKALQALGERILTAVEAALDLAPGVLTSKLRGGPHVTRLLRYLPMDQSNVDAGALWGENHTDFCAMTILPGGRFFDADGAAMENPGDGSGLFLTSRSGERVSGSPPPGCLVVQVGQQLEVLTGGTLLATPHEIRAPRTPGPSRLSCAHFMHLHTAQTVFPLEPFQSPEAVLRYRPPVLAGTYDTKILVDIGLAPSEALEGFGYSNQDRIASQRELDPA